MLARFASLHCLPAWFAALCLLSVVSALAGFIHLLVKGTLFWFVVCASRGHRFALGTGGLKQSLLVGGIGPVYSLPKLCFKPFRKSEKRAERTWVTLKCLHVSSALCWIHLTVTLQATILHDTLATRISSNISCNISCETKHRDQPACGTHAHAKKAHLHSTQTKKHISTHLLIVLMNFCSLRRLTPYKPAKENLTPPPALFSPQAAQKILFEGLGRSYHEGLFETMLVGNGNASMVCSSGFGRTTTVASVRIPQGTAVETEPQVKTLLAAKADTSKAPSLSTRARGWAPVFFFLGWSELTWWFPAMRFLSFLAFWRLAGIISISATKSEAFSRGSEDRVKLTSGFAAFRWTLRARPRCIGPPGAHHPPQGS